MPTTRTIKLAKLHPAQAHIVNHLTRFNLLRCGRRFGKTSVVIDVVLNDLLDGRKVSYFTPTYRMGSEVWREIIHKVTPIIKHVDRSERRLELYTGGLLECWSLTANTAQSVRGRKYHRVVMDEASYVRDGSVWDEAIRPLLTDYQGSAIFAFTPKGRNWVFPLSMLALDPLMEDWSEFHYSSYDNPHIPKEEIDLAKLTLPERVFLQEYMAEFTDDAGTVFRGVMDVSVLETRDPYDSEFVMGVDWARDQDFTVISIIDKHTREQVYLDRFNKIGWKVQRGRVRAQYERWKPSMIVAEVNSIGSVNIEELQAEGLPVRGFVTSPKSKPPLIDALAVAIERKKIKLLNDKVQIAELQAYELDRTRSGNYKYGAPPGAHDDTVMALAMALWGCEHTASISFWDESW